MGVFQTADGVVMITFEGKVATLCQSHFTLGLEGSVESNGRTTCFASLANGGQTTLHIPMRRASNGTLPTFENGAITCASPVISNNVRLTGLQGGGTKKGLLLIKTPLGFESTGLPFPKPSSGRYKPHRLIWPAGEGVDLLHVQAGSRKADQQVQLFALDPGQSLVVADLAERTVIVTFTASAFKLRTAVPKDLLEHVGGRMNGARDSREVFWCRDVATAILRAGRQHWGDCREEAFHEFIEACEQKLKHMGVTF